VGGLWRVQLSPDEGEQLLADTGVGGNAPVGQESCRGFCDAPGGREDEEGKRG